MEITVKLHHETKDCTVSKLYIDGRFECYVLEDESRVVKVRGETRIPAGRYRIVMHPKSRFQAQYLKKFGEVHRFGMLLLQKVPGFDGVLIHIGNTDDDSDGCLLVGQTFNGVSTIGGSARAYQALYGKVAPEVVLATNDKEGAWITITR